MESCFSSLVHCDSEFADCNPHGRVADMFECLTTFVYCASVSRESVPHRESAGVQKCISFLEKHRTERICTCTEVCFFFYASLLRVTRFCTERCCPIFKFICTFCFVFIEEFGPALTWSAVAPVKFEKLELQVNFQRSTVMGIVDKLCIEVRLERHQFFFIWRGLDCSLG